jgi:hypothetical protein
MKLFALLHAGLATLGFLVLVLIVVGAEFYVLVHDGIE